METEKADAEEVIYHLLTNDATLTAALSKDGVYPGYVPQGADLPAIAYGHITTTSPMNVNLTSSLSFTRIQVSVLAKTYAEQKSLIKLVSKACRNFQGDVNGIAVNSVIRDTVGPDLRDDEAGLYMQTVDFRVAYKERE